jgi:hypothetical protein
MAYDFDTATVTRIDPAEWLRKQTMALNRLDALAREMERKWGHGRLLALVPDDLAERFLSQHRKMRAALQAQDFKQAVCEIDRMANAWRALDSVAERSGASVISPIVWETLLSDGTVVAIVRDDDEAHAVDPVDRKMRVYTLDEIARLIEGFPQIAAIKDEFPGATVKDVRERVPPPDEWWGDTGDEIPF